MEKPLCLRLEEATTEIAAVINKHKKEHGLPCFLLEPILRDFYLQVAEGKKAEVELTRREYEKALEGSEDGD